MADFKNYNGENIETLLLATTTSPGLIAAEDKVKVDKVKAIAKVTVGDTAIEAEGVADEIKLENGSNVNLNVDPENKKIVIAANNTTYDLSTVNSAANGNVKLNLVPNSGTTDSVSIKGTGATSVTTDASGVITINSSNTTYEDATTSSHGLMTAAMVNKLNGIADGANKYTHPSYTARSSGLYKITVDGSGHVSAATPATKTDIVNLGIPSVDTTYGTMTGATSDTAGSPGLVPAPEKGASNRYLRSDGTWVVPPDTNTTYNDATTSSHGLMTAAMVNKLNGIADGANKYTHPSYTAKASGLYKVTVDGTGHVSAVAAVTKADITALGIPGQDTNTVYTHPSTHPASMITQDGSHRFVTDSEKSTWNAKVGLDSNGFIPSSVLPSYVDDVIEGYLSGSKFYKSYSNGNYTGEITGETGKIYINLSNNKTYRWSGSGYAVISETLALGETSSTAYAGNKGAANAASISNIINGSTKVGKASNADTVNGLSVHTAVPANAKFTDTVYTHPSYTARTSGLYKVTVDGTGHVSAVAAVTKADITALGIPGQDTNTTYNDMTGATSDANGSHGLVPAPAKGASNRYLRSDGTWQVPPDTNATYNDATTSSHGLMTAAMVNKLNGIAAGANNYTHPSSHPASMISQDGSHRFVTDSEKSTWNSKSKVSITDDGAGNVKINIS